MNDNNLRCNYEESLVRRIWKNLCDGDKNQNCKAERIDAYSKMQQKHQRKIDKTGEKGYYRREGKKYI